MEDNTQQPDVGLVSDMPDLRDKPLEDYDADDQAALDAVLRRIAPDDGSRVLLVAASFNSAI